MKELIAIGGLFVLIVLPAQESLSASKEVLLAQMESGPKTGITLKVVDDRNDAVVGAIRSTFSERP